MNFDPVAFALGPQGVAVAAQGSSDGGGAGVASAVVSALINEDTGGGGVPGSLEESGWYEIPSGYESYVEIDGNTMTLKSGSSSRRIRIRPPADVVSNRFFQQGDEVVVALTVFVDSGTIYIQQWGATEHKNGTLTTKGFFVKTTTDEYEMRSHCTGTGKDVLTYDFSQGNVHYLDFDPRDASGKPSIDDYATIVVTGLKYNGTVIFGKV